MDGAAEGVADGTNEGSAEGMCEGMCEGIDVGLCDTAPNGNKKTKNSSIILNSITTVPHLPTQLTNCRDQSLQFLALTNISTIIMSKDTNKNNLLLEHCVE